MSRKGQSDEEEGKLYQFGEWLQQHGRSDSSIVVEEEDPLDITSYLETTASSGITAPLNPEKRTTIDNLSTKRSEELSDLKNHSPPRGAPQNYLFHPAYDSEESDGSIVFSHNQVTNSNSFDSFPGNQQHNRLPSFDSVASSESFRVIPSAPSPYVAPNVTPKPPAMLPYDQRRKLLQQKRQQQQQQPVAPPPSNKFQRHDAAGRPHPSSLLTPPSAVYPITPETAHVPTPQADYDQQHFTQPHASYQGLNYIGPPLPPPQQQLPPSGYRLSQNKQNQKSEGIRNGQARLLVPQHTLPPIGNSRVLHTGGPRLPSPNRGRLSSADDSSSPDKERPLRYVPRMREGGLPPPPPPPPANHQRADSSGSISSLGSAGGGAGISTFTERLDGDIAGFIDQEKSDPHTDNFVAEFMSKSDSRSHQRQYSVEDFHEQNQKFLQQAKRQQSSPQQTKRRVVSNRLNLRSDTPPRSKGGHRRLTSIENDEWEEKATSNRQRELNPRHHRETTSSDGLSDSEVSQSSLVNERAALIPAPGISSREYTKERRTSGKMREKQRSSRPQRSRHSHESGRHERSLIDRNEDSTVRFDNRASVVEQERARRPKKEKRKKKKKNARRHSRRYKNEDSEESDFSDDSISSSSDNFDYRQWTKKRARMLEKERAKLVAQWKAEARADAERAMRDKEANSWYKRVGQSMEEKFTSYLEKVLRFFALLETFISNLPLTIGAIALAIVTLGVVWFKFAEENLESCQPVHFHSSQCTFPEFPGCFYCDTDATMYKVALGFHFTCSAIAGVLALTFVLKIILATRVVLDELSSPTTASPAGLICMTVVCVFAGRGLIGQFLVSAAAATHLCLAIWFIYCALAYHIMPEPSWFPNTVGIGLSAVKAWTYYPMCGHLLMAISLSLNFFFFPISLIRVTLNQKISAPVAWIQMSAPAISLYALTIMAQPSFEEEHPDVTKFQRVHRMIYLPCMHFLFALAVLGALSSIQGLLARWGDFQKKTFSPAHAAFCFPTLAHANAIQAYRGAVNTFSDIPARAPFKIILYGYWVFVLVSGTLTTLYVTWRFFYMLPTWTQIDVEDEVEPPAPYETSLTLQDVISTGETMRQSFVSPAVLQANETGALVMLPRGADGKTRYRRTRHITALGFEPIMQWSELNREREVLLDWVGKNPPKRRTRTLSVPGIDFNYGYDFGSGNSGVFGGDDRQSPRHARGMSFQPPRTRSNTKDGFQYF